jgi:hypothetical protein
MQDDILRLAYEVSRLTGEKIGLIEQVTHRTKILALNARIEASRAGAAGAAFGVVAQEIGEVSTGIRSIANDLRLSVNAQMGELEKAGEHLMTDFRGTRLTDLALNAIEIIDRNLYERSCDVRWWATDSAVVTAAERPDAQSLGHASARLATILRSYTVYLDLWIVDGHGTVIANGRPDIYRQAVGSNVSRAEWFQRALATRTGDDFAVADIERNQALNNAPVATYATAIRENGRTDGPPVGVLGIFFDWAPQASAVVRGVRLSEDEKDSCRVLLLDARHRVIAASDDHGFLTETFAIASDGRNRGHYTTGDRLVAFALTPGYETYGGLGWYGVVEHRRGAATDKALRRVG